MSMRPRSVAADVEVASDGHKRAHVDAVAEVLSLMSMSPRSRISEVALSSDGSPRTVLSLMSMCTVVRSQSELRSMSPAEMLPLMLMSPVVDTSADVDGRRGRVAADVDVAADGHQRTHVDDR